MDGRYLNDNTNIEGIIKQDLTDWVISATQYKDGWHANNLYINEVKFFKDIKREDWLEKSLLTFKVLLREFKLISTLLPFIHIHILDSKKHVNVEAISLSWLKGKMHRRSPPSFNYSSLSYYQSSYLRELTPLRLKSSLIQCNLNMGFDLDFYHNIFYRESEKAYLRSIYIFYAGHTKI